MSTFLTDIAKALKTDPKTGDMSFYGVIKEKITDGATVTGYKVSIGGDEDIVVARKMAGAEEGDTVMCTLLSNGSVVVTGRRDGDYDAIKALDEATIAQNLAVEAISEVEDLTMHFWYDELGAHVKGGQSGYQTDLTSNGMIIKNGSGDTLAKYQARTTQIGIDSEIAQILLCSNNYQIIGSHNTTSTSTTEWGLFISPTVAANRTGGDGVWIQTSPDSSSQNNARVYAYSDGQYHAGMAVGKPGVGKKIEITNDLAVMDMGSAEIKAETNKVSMRTGSYSYVVVDSTSARIFFDEGHGLRINGTDAYFYCNLRVAGTVTGSNIPSGTIATLDDIPDIPSGTILTSSNYSNYYDYSGKTVSATLFNMSNLTTYDGGYDLVVAGNGNIRRGTGSSQKFKKYISSNNNDLLEKVKGLYDLPVKTWKFKNDFIDKDCHWYNKQLFGVIAEEIAEVIPESARYDGDEIVNYSDRILLNAVLMLVQDQHKEINNLQVQINELKGAN